MTIIFIIAIILIILISGVIFAEITLYLLEKITGSRKFSFADMPPRYSAYGIYEKRLKTKDVSTTSSNVFKPSKSNKTQLKIAVFGGSAAWGYTSERSISEIIAALLKTQDEEIELYVANYAFAGSPFHRCQAEI